MTHNMIIQSNSLERNDMAQAIHLGKAAPWVSLYPVIVLKPSLTGKQIWETFWTCIPLMNATILRVLFDGLPSNGLCRLLTT